MSTTYMCFIGIANFQKFIYKVSTDGDPKTQVEERAE